MRLGSKSGLLSLSLVCLLVAASVSNAAVIGSWTQSPSGANANFTFNVASDIGNVTSLELSFSAGAGSTFSNEFSDNIFDSDGLLAGFRDSFLLFSPAVTSPGAAQAKSETKLQAAFTGFTPFANKNVAQLIVVGNAVEPIATNIVGTQGRMGTAVIETIPGDPLSRQEFPILGNLPGRRIPPVITPIVKNIELLVNEGELAALQLTAADETSAVGDLVWSALAPGGSNPGKSPLFPNATDPSMNGDGVFSWNPNGWQEGTYLFNATVEDEAGNEVASLALTVNLTVPEPATLSLLGLALVGFAGMARRRS